MKSNWEIGRLLVIVGPFFALVAILAASPGAGFNYEGTTGMRPSATAKPSATVLARETKTGAPAKANHSVSAAGTNSPGNSPFTTSIPWNYKVHLATVDPREVLDKVAALPMTKWKYQGESKPIVHMGPVGENFNEAFHLGGNSDGNVTVVDESGVALAAIQGLNQKVEAQAAEIKDRDARIKALEKRLDDLEKLMTTVAQH